MLSGLFVDEGCSGYKTIYCCPAKLHTCLPLLHASPFFVPDNKLSILKRPKPIRIMYSTKVLLTVAALTGASMAQTSTVFPDPDCPTYVSELVAAAPTTPPELVEVFEEVSGSSPHPEDLFLHPEEFVDNVCSAVGELPQSVLPIFASWGSVLLEFASTEIASYDHIVTQCVATGTEGASITSYIHSIASNPADLCQDLSSAPPSVSASLTSYPVPTGSAAAARL
ncbi:hypothetical protein GGR58DRAFT_460713 [Xylaria digitata]|nr:hypothetical protein GGR58DRAFT_460713 [Xylaria digitata]